MREDSLSARPQCQPSLGLQFRSIEDGDRHRGAAEPAREGEAGHPGAHHQHRHRAAVRVGSEAHAI
eukprot:6173766-Pleurochrysis_carterae.AAC.4